MTTNTADTSTTPLLRLRGVGKKFGQVEALSDVQLDVYPGEVVALVGDNGAGKSTLIKTISGVQPADSGEFRFAGETVVLRSAEHSAALGIAIVYQDLALCDNLDVAANLFLGRETSRGGILDQVSMLAEAQRLLASLDVKTVRSLRMDVGLLSGGQRQSIAIARSLLGSPRLVILDEPTAALGVAQTAQVLNLVKRLKSQGLGVILISHNLADVFEVADRIVVLRLGRNAGAFPADRALHGNVVGAITGAAPAPQADDLGLSTLDAVESHAGTEELR